VNALAILAAFCAILVPLDRISVIPYVQHWEFGIQRENWAGTPCGDVLPIAGSGRAKNFIGIPQSAIQPDRHRDSNIDTEHSAGPRHVPC